MPDSRTISGSSALRFTVANDIEDHSPMPDSVVAVYATEADLILGVKHAQDAPHPVTGLSFLGNGPAEAGFGTADALPSSARDRWAQWGALWGWIFGAFVYLPELGHVAVGGYLLFDRLPAGRGSAARSLREVGLPSAHSAVYAAELRSDHFLVIAHGACADVDRAHHLLGKTAHARLDRHRGGSMRATIEVQRLPVAAYASATE